MPVSAVARRLGVAPATLRTWDRRYGLGPSRHTGGKHRRYGAADINRLELMQRALLRGASTAEAARFALAQAPGTVPDAEVAEPFGLPEPAEAPDRSLARQLRSAALAMDGAAVQRLLADSIADAGVLASWENVIDPVLTAFGAGWDGTHARPEAEYLLSECVLGALIRATPVPREPRNQRPVLLSCVPGERGALPLYALAACLAERDVGTQLLGAAPPADVLAVAVRRSAPSAVVLLARREPVAEPRLFSRLARGRQRSRLFALGEGWSRAALPGKIEMLSDLRQAVGRVEYVLLGR
ncbi:MerR family transcriptional regulator [Amycolatopsis sp. K13G38]|uniref:MerR family transcriptional regulator n=1 Tax=Amycolatopsis acididurans TaxID=2724524 RepID=A0ABX1JEF5_9PSEU|nr:MerR family transcriptional regulator [Amycolatopsis acididurans]NKQ58124.1 MerR family transcriptional regulator [Amycolatopsis acididurans]